MLILTRKIGHAFIIMDDIRVVILGVDRDRVKVGIEAPMTIPIVREELLTRDRSGSVTIYRGTA